MSAGVAAWIAHVTFWLLLGYGWAWDEIGPRGAAIFVGLWLLAGHYTPHLPPADGPVTSMVSTLLAGPAVDQHADKHVSHHCAAGMHCGGAFLLVIAPLLLLLGQFRWAAGRDCRDGGLAVCPDHGPPRFSS